MFETIRRLFHIHKWTNWFEMVFSEGHYDAGYWQERYCTLCTAYQQLLEDGTIITLYEKDAH